MPVPLSRTQFEDSSNHIRARLLCHRKISHNPPDRNGMYLGKMRISTFQLSFICVGLCLCAVCSFLCSFFHISFLWGAVMGMFSCLCLWDCYGWESEICLYWEFSSNAIADDVMGFLLTECTLIDCFSNSHTHCGSWNCATETPQHFFVLSNNDKYGISEWSAPSCGKSLIKNDASLIAIFI